MTVTDVDRLLTTKEACALLRIDEKTLRAHVASGDIAYVLVGAGLRRPRRRFTLADIQAFIDRRRRREACPSTSPGTRRTTTTTSRSNVVAFTDLLAEKTGATPKE